MRALNGLGDRLLERLLPKTTAKAWICWTENCCNYKYCRSACQNTDGSMWYGPWDYC